VLSTLRRLVAWATVALALAGTAPATAGAIGNADVAALQVALRARGLYGGTVDGSLGPATAEAVRRFQARNRLAVDGVPGRRTRRALGSYGRAAPLGVRVLYAGRTGWDVASLQFLLAWQGFPSGALDGRFGPRTDRALRLFQAWAGLGADGRAGPGTVAALHRPPATAAIALASPYAGAPTDLFGPRGARFHSGIDYPGAIGAPVLAAASGRVTQARRLAGWGRLVVVDHGFGIRTWYAHLSAISVRVGSQVSTGALVGLLGASGNATGPHLHFEVQVRGAAVDPLRSLV
jgi:murein DD-endopeptidase MepM/ murein hydrolase activator NlpD